MFKKIPGSICAPRGFQTAAVFCDIKKLGTGKGSDKGKKRDLALIVSDVSAAVAGMFTTNQVCAAPVKLSARRAARKSARAIVVNSGNANACTGGQGMQDAEAMARTSAACVAALHEPGQKTIRAAVIDSLYNVLVCSTGRIGVPMPMRNVREGIHRCARLLARSVQTARHTAEAIMTSDTRPKEIAFQFKIDRVSVRLGGICKGAGMIQPRMNFHPGRHRHATMLAFFTTDAAIEPDLLKKALGHAVGQSFNRITVDGDMSTNDSVIALANGLAGNRKIAARDSRFAIFQEALTLACIELAKMMVRDGEGVSRFVTLRIRNAKSAADAEAAARAVANSSLVKTSWCGGDPNWGRILCALGYSSARVEEPRVNIGYSRMGSRKVIFGFRNGRPARVSWPELTRITSAPEFEVHVDLNLGRHDFVLYSSDLTEDYVAFNKGGITDPKSLGG